MKTFELFNVALVLLLVLASLTTNFGTGLTGSIGLALLAIALFWTGYTIIQTFRTAHSGIE